VRRRVAVGLDQRSRRARRPLLPGKLFHRHGPMVLCRQLHLEDGLVELLRPRQVAYRNFEPPYRDGLCRGRLFFLRCVASTNRFRHKLRAPGRPGLSSRATVYSLPDHADSPGAREVAHPGGADGTEQRGVHDEASKRIDEAHVRRGHAAYGTNVDRPVRGGSRPRAPRARSSKPRERWRSRSRSRTHAEERRERGEVPLQCRSGRAKRSGSPP